MTLPINSVQGIKTTIDKMGLDISKEIFGTKGVAIDLDGAQEVREKLLSKKDSAIVWRLLDFSTTPRASLFNLSVAFGSSIEKDKNNMLAMSVAGTIPNKFCVGQSLEVRDYLKKVNGEYPLIGRWAIDMVDMNPQISDGTRGFRLVVVSGTFFEQIH